MIKAVPRSPLDEVSLACDEAFEAALLEAALLEVALLDEAPGALRIRCFTHGWQSTTRLEMMANVILRPNNWF